MNKVLIVLASISGSLAVGQTATVDVKAAEQFRVDIRSAMDQNTQNLRQPDKRRAHGANLDALVRRSERLFGDQFNQKFGSCVKAAGLMRSGWADQLSLISSTSPIGVGTHTTMTFEAGIEYWNCRLAIDSLTPSIPDECLKRYDLSKPTGGELPRPDHCKKLNP